MGGRGRPQQLTGDKAYTGQQNPLALQRRGIRVTELRRRAPRWEVGAARACCHPQVGHQDAQLGLSRNVNLLVGKAVCQLSSGAAAC